MFLFIFLTEYCLGYTKREIKQADKAELLSVARAMNDDFEPKVRKLFNAEVQAADRAIQTGNLIMDKKAQWNKIKILIIIKVFMLGIDVLNSHGTV